MSKLRRWLPSVLCLMLIWAVVSLAARLVLSAKPSAGDTLELLKTGPGDAGNEEAVQTWIASVVSRMSQLDLDSRHRVLLDPSFRTVFSTMSTENQTRLLAAIELRGMRDLIEGSKRWSRGRYERLSAPALADLETLKPGSIARFEAMFAEPNQESLARTGIEAFLKHTDPVSRLEILPWMERMQKYSQQGR